MACHDDVTAGHLGVTRSLDKIQKRFFWPRLAQQVIRYVRSCTDCQTKKRSTERRAGMLKSVKSSEPFERVGIDLIGPFPPVKIRKQTHNRCSRLSDQMGDSTAGPACKDQGSGRFLRS